MADLNKDELHLILRALEIYQHNNKTEGIRNRINDLYSKISKYDWIPIPENKTKESEQIRSSHYGGADNPYEAIKVIDAWNAGFNLGNAIKYICRVCHVLFQDVMLAHTEDDRKKWILDLKKAKTYLEFEIEKLEKSK